MVSKKTITESQYTAEIARRAAEQAQTQQTQTPQAQSEDTDSLIS
jgi:hypothetical protein